MTWLHPALLAGLGLVAIPVLLHFLMRQKPKKLVFPALRLVQQQRRQNSKRFRLRHLWLLLLRMAALAAIVFAIARPTLPAANYGLNLREGLTLAAVVIAGVAAYFVTLYRWRSRTWPRYEFNLQRTKLRGWVTGATVVLALLLTGYPYQRRVAAEITSPAPTGQFDLPVAAVYLFDTSLSLQYTQEGKSRLDVAKELAKSHLQDFPSGSRVAITETSNDAPVIFQASISAAQSRIDALELSAVSVTINDRLTGALALQTDDRKRVAAEGDAAKDRFIRRVYVFTDLAATAWRMGESTALSRGLEQLPGLSIQIVDVGDLEPKNTALTGLSLSRTQLSTDSPLVIGGDIVTTGEAGERKLVLSILSAAGQMVPRDTVDVPLQAGVPQHFDFNPLTGLKGPVIHGEVRSQSSDPMQFDDARSFTAFIGARPKVVLVAPSPEESTEIREALELVGYQPVVITPLQLATADLSRYQIAFLLNVEAPSDETWNKLATFVNGGGGLAVVLGSGNIKSVPYNRAAAQQILPARLDVWQGQGESKTPYRFSVDRKEHPLFWKYRVLDAEYSAFAAFESETEVYRFWRTTDRAADATIAATFSDRDHVAALLDRPHGRGRTVLFTTSMHLPASNANRWNDLPSPNKEPWQWLAFVEQLAGHLSRSTVWQVNVTAGEPATVPIEPSDHDRELLLQRPAFAQSKVDVKGLASEITTGETRVPGQYSFTVAGRPGALSGYSVNASDAESDLKRATEEQLVSLLGKGRFQIARTLDELKADVNVSDLGKEVFPLVLLLAILAFCGEHFVANWFYEADSERGGSESKPTRPLATGSPKSGRSAKAEAAGAGSPAR